MYIIGSFILSRASKVMRFEPGVDTQFPHESGKTTEYVDRRTFLNFALCVSPRD